MLAAGDFRSGPEKHWQCEQHQGAEVNVRYLPLGGVQPALAELTVVRLSPEKANWHVQFKQAGLRVQEGRTYTVEFRARAERERPLAVSMMQNHEPWSNLGLSRRVTVGPDWERLRFSFRATGTEADDARLNFSLGSDAGKVWLSAVSLRPGLAVLEEGESLERGTVRAPDRSPTLATARQTDYVRFLNDVEMDFFAEMRDYIKKDLGCRAPVTGTIGYGLPGVAVQAEMDFVDAHAYWQHPRFPTRPWSRTDWYVPNLAMVDDPEGSTIARLALGRVAGKPFTVTEYNHPAPNEFRAECIPLIAAYGALQDWDGIFIFGYHHATDDWDREHIASYFDIDSDPGRMVQMPVGAAVVRRGDVSPALGSCTYRLSREAACVATGQTGLRVPDNLQGLGHHPNLALRVRTYLEFDQEAQVIQAPEAAAPSGLPLLSDTGEIRWDVDEERGGLVTIDTRGKAIKKNEVGHICGGEERLMAEVLRIQRDTADMQVFEDTRGVRVGDPVEMSGNLVSVDLGPGL